MRLAPFRFAAALCALVPGIASASPVDARLTTKGLKFVETQVKALVPSVLDLDPTVITLSDTVCSQGPITLTQESTHLEIQLESFTLTPIAGALRIDVVVSVEGNGSSRFDRVYACYGNETCDETISIQHAHFTIDLAASIDGQGKPHIAIQNPVIDIKPENLSFELSGCPEAGIVDALYGLVEKFAVQVGTLVAESLVSKQVGPQLEGMIANYLTFKGNAGFVNYQATLTGVDLSTNGVTIIGDVDLTSVYPMAACLASDPGEPGAVAGAVPDLSGGTPTDVSVAVNLGVVQDAIYHVWHEGLLCITPDTLNTLKVDLSALNQLATLLPDFPLTTTWAIEANVAVPPTIEGSPANAAKLAVHVNQVGLDLIANLPDKSTRTLHVDLDATLTASVIVDPASNALALEVDGVKIDQMNVVDHLGLEASGVSMTHLQQLLETQILPGTLGSLGQIPVTGPVFGGIANAYVILRGFTTTPGYLMVKADLFMAPATDNDAPTTAIVSKPDHLVMPSDAKLVLGGTDKQDPTELLRYRVSVDGKLSDPTYVRTLTVGQVGKSGLVHVEVHAIDLAGNEDKKGVTADIDVDGVAPTLMVTDSLRGAVGDLSPTVHFVAMDDRTAATALVTHVTVTEVGGAAKNVMDVDLAAGARDATLSGLAASHSYQAVFTVRDQAGNSASSTMRFDVSSDASGGGCHVAGGSSGALTLLIVAAALVLARRRRA